MIDYKPIKNHLEDCNHLENMCLRFTEESRIQNWVHK